MRNLASWLSGNILIACGCVLATHLGRDLMVASAVKPAIWPVAGLALTAMMIGGMRGVVGVAVGSFLGHILILESDLSQLAMCQAGFGGAVGTIGQSLLAICVIRRVLGPSLELQRERQVAFFYLVIGPFSCVISASIWAATLWWSCGLEVHDLGFAWFAAWTCDSIAAIFFVPITLCLFSRSLSQAGFWRSRRLSVALPLALCLAFVATMLTFAQTREEERQAHALNRRASDYSSAVERTLDMHLDTLCGINSLYAASEHVSRAEFGQFTREWIRQAPSIQAFGWIPRVPLAKRSSWETTLSTEFRRRMTISERNSRGSLKTASPREEHFPGEYVEPMPGNELAFGFDIASNPERFAALRRARDSGKAVATARVKLIQEVSDQFAVLVLMPIYRQGRIPQTVTERRESLTGFALGEFRIVDVLISAFDEWSLPPFMLAGSTSPPTRGHKHWGP